MEVVSIPQHRHRHTTQLRRSKDPKGRPGDCVQVHDDGAPSRVKNAPICSLYLTYPPSIEHSGPVPIFPQLSTAHMQNGPKIELISVDCWHCIVYLKSDSWRANARALAGSNFQKKSACSYLPCRNGRLSCHLTTYSLYALAIIF